MSNAEKLLEKYDDACIRLETAIRNPPGNRYTIDKASELWEKARAKVLAAMEGNHDQGRA